MFHSNRIVRRMNDSIPDVGFPRSVRRFSTILLVTALLQLWHSHGVAALPEQHFPDASSLRPMTDGLPDPLVMLDGRRVASKSQWLKERRPELKSLFSHYMYGPIPPRPGGMKTKLIGNHGDFLDGKAKLKLVTLETGPAPAPRIDLMLVVPNDQREPAPVFLAMDFCGNHAITPDSRVPLARSWMGSFCKGCANNTATDAARGSQAVDWPLSEIVRRGYALATFYSGDIDPDRSDASIGIYAWL